MNADCKFPAKELILYRRHLADNHPETNGDDAVAKSLRTTLSAIDALRWEHAEQTGCTCWYEAIKHCAPVEVAR